MEATKTKGYICHDTEAGAVWYVMGDGSLWRANHHNVLDTQTGYALGRNEGPKWQVVDRLLMLRKFVPSATQREIDAYLVANHASETLAPAFA